MDDRIKLSWFATAYDKVPRPVEATWQDLRQALTGMRIRPGGRKDLQPRISPVEYLPGAERASTAVLRATFLMADFDKLDAGQMMSVLGIASGLRCCVHTTWSHPERNEASGTWSFRLAAPMTRSVDAREWPGFWRRMRVHFGGLVDRQASDISRMYILPCCPREHRSNFAKGQEGAPFDVDRLMAMPDPGHDPASAAGSGIRRISRDDLLSLSASLSRNTSDGARQVSKALKDIAAGQPFAEPGERDKAMFLVAGRIAERWPDADASSVASIAEPAIEAMSRIASGCPGVGVLEDKLRRACSRIAEERDRLAKDREDSLSNGCVLAIGRPDPYTHEEIEGFARGAGCTVHTFQNRWIAQCSHLYYVYRMGTYLPAVPAESLPAIAAVQLAPARSAGVSVWTRDSKGEPRRKTARELVEEYGIGINAVIADLSAQRTRIEPREKGLVMIEATCPLRRIASERVPEIEAWLEALGGEEHGRLLDWIASVTWLDRPSMALYLDGPTGSGKTLLAHGLSRLWTTDRPTYLRSMVGSWNDAFLRCPLVLADEALPEEMARGKGTGTLREMIQETSWDLRKRWADEATIKGSMRLILAANNPYLIGTAEAWTPADVKAITERILYIKVPQAASDMLRGLGTAACRAWVQDDLLASHALWLRDTRRFDSSHRFIVAPKAGLFHAALPIRQRIESAVCNWCVAYLLDPVRMDTARQEGIMVEDGQLLVTSKAILECWDMYTTNEKPPDQRRLGMAIANLSLEGRVHKRGADGRQIQYKAINGSLLLGWAQDSGYCTEDDLVRALAEASMKGRKQ